jgi:hypothetical protein
VPRYVLYLYNSVYIDGFETYKDKFWNPETVFRESGVGESAICDFVINLKSSI